jgi:hypothetical protein
MRGVLSEKPEKNFTIPEGMTELEICALSGLLPTEHCQNRRREWFIPGTEPVIEDAFHKTVEIDLRTGVLADETTPLDWLETWIVLDLPPEAHPWARRNGLVLLDDLVETQDSIVDDETGNEEVIWLHTPASNTVYFLSTSIPADLQKIEILAYGEPDLAAVSLWVDGVQIAEFSDPPYKAWWLLAAGEHLIWAEAAQVDGEQIVSAPVTIEVRIKE